jgi:hypothetical protein
MEIDDGDILNDVASAVLSAGTGCFERFFNVGGTEIVMPLCRPFVSGFQKASSFMMSLRFV